ncbi:MAG: penicillin-binding protein 2 [Verrucomicrobiaceae bacterium]|nr:penicillin-binding protein 2 [Verrucomicrobiaceae bacterium]
MKFNFHMGLLALVGLAAYWAPDLTAQVPKAVPVEDEPTPPPAALPVKPPRAEPVEDEPTMVPKAVPVEESETKPTTPAPEEKPKPKPKPIVPLVEEPPPPPKPKKDIFATWQVQKDARPLRLEIPAPRGQIVDRNGKAFARNRVVYFASLNFPLLQPDTPEAILSFAKERIDEANKLLGKTWSLSDERILNHYKYRRWLPLIFSTSNDMNVELTNSEQEKLKPLFAKRVMLHPTYQREYPLGQTACHIIGYTGRRQPLPTKEIVEGEPFAEEPMGRSGLEFSFEQQLRGTPGAISLVFNATGELIEDEILRKPVPGHNVVTTLDYKMQRYAESALRSHARNGGAMVIMDVRNGEILAMASNPGFDLNEFIPGISNERYAALRDDEKSPLFGRAFQSNYFPASTFKVVTALAALESGTVTAGTTYDCDGYFNIGKESFRNWHSEGEGPMTVVDAIKRSCNTWFYQAGLDTGSNKVIAMAERLGFGQPTGIPISGEARGFVPTDAYYMQRFGHKILPGFLCSISIGQIVTCSPLQAAQCMAAVADGQNMSQPRLVKQIQDLNDRVVQAWEPEVKSRIALDQKARDTVVRGMIAVVSGDGGTGKGASIKHAQIAGKTGTAQWKIYKDDSKNRNLAWFTGFVPANNPVYAFAAVYEGAPGENVSGGRVAAPIVQEVFNNIYEGAAPDDPLLKAAEEAPKALLADDSDVSAGDQVAKAKPAEEAPPEQQAPPPSSERGLRGMFRRLFRR